MLSLSAKIIKMQKFFFFFFFLWIRFVISTNSTCLILQSSNSFGGSRTGSCFEVSVTDLKQMIIYTQSSVVGFSFTLNDGTNRSFLENSVYSNNYTIELRSKAVDGVNVYIGKGIEGLQFQFDNSASTPIFGKTSGCLYYLNSTFMKIQYFMINLIQVCVDNANSSYFPYIAFSYSFSKCPLKFSPTSSTILITNSTITSSTQSSAILTVTNSFTTSSNSTATSTTILGMCSYNNQTCSSSAQCIEPLICNLISNSSCNCPAKVEINKCDCPRSFSNEYFWNGTTCIQAASYNSSCDPSFNYTCQTLTQNTFCDPITNKCGCISDSSVWNSTMCLSCPKNWTLLRNSCFIGSSSKYVFSSLTTYIVVSKCYNESTSQIARLINTDSRLTFFYSNTVAFPKPYYFFNAYRIGVTQTYQSGSNVLNVLSPYWNGTANYNCSYFDKNSLSTLYFVSSPCNTLEFFMCEVQLI